ncbi:short-chain dehydrogenase/reductase family 16C member 6-like isoform X3 [Phlebotomus argentipes]|uniref:short-chain dehydrogenase/reductase family 16C member 6-like isoform X3 n=1 Tax=Phlebotomus argentipes TaxID=94469 RepID=UPI0028929DC5|nr:short-chain dehydrogenase/reductase family 16C member 6-like isoform X3 [Phlebotomus argentipes]
MTDNRNASQNPALRLYSVFTLIADIIGLLLKFTLEVIYSFMKLFVKTELKDVSGEVVLITGAGHGIGRELAIQYTDLGCEVVCLDINEAGNAETVEMANALRQGRAYAFTCDVTDRDQVLAVANRIRVQVGHVSVIVNNAGIMPSRPLWEQQHQEIRKVFDVNVMAHFWIFEAFLPHMIEKNRGHLVSISSVVGLIGAANLVPYCASKFAVRGMMEALFEELREHKIPVLLIALLCWEGDPQCCNCPNYPRKSFNHNIG